MANEDLSKLKIEKPGPGVYRSKTKRPLLYIALVVVVVIVAALYFTGILSPAVEVETASVSLAYPSQGITILNASGYVVPQRKAAVASRITSRLVSLSAEEGNIVKKGDVLAKLENEDAIATREQAAANLKVSQSDLEQTKAELRDAAINFDRFKELSKEGLVSKFDYDSADLRFRKASSAVAGAEYSVKANNAALQGADVTLGYSYIRAPFDAVVLTKNADIGDIITPLGAAANAQASVFTLADMASLQVEADVSESNLEQVKKGQPCEIQLDAFPDSRFRGEVYMIVPTADRTKATVMVKVRFIDHDSRILPEMSAKVAFLQRPVTSEEQKPRTAINPSAIITSSGKKHVFLVKGDQVIETPITTGEQIGDMIEVISGIKTGDKIVLKPLDKLKNGSKIKFAAK
ncbi:MAG: efflux transporter periplasmic adaptor subunit [Nitrospirae bacterium GWC2_42_7]|nr:MAG: efflux transporter periplasmic adaptor subunit [Nitrospirae bacterium GWC2_42_7]